MDKWSQWFFWSGNSIRYNFICFQFKRQQPEVEGLLVLFPRLDLSSWSLVAIPGKNSHKPHISHHSYAGKGCTSLGRANTAVSDLYLVASLLCWKCSVFWLIGTECLHHVGVPELDVPGLVCLDSSVCVTGKLAQDTELLQLPQPGTMPTTVYLAL